MINQEKKVSIKQYIILLIIICSLNNINGSVNTKASLLRRAFVNLKSVIKNNPKKSWFGGGLAAALIVAKYGPRIKNYFRKKRIEDQPTGSLNVDKINKYLHENRQVKDRNAIFDAVIEDQELKENMKKMLDLLDLFDLEIIKIIYNLPEYELGFIGDKQWNFNDPVGYLKNIAEWVPTQEETFFIESAKLANNLVANNIVMISGLNKWFSEVKVTMEKIKVKDKILLQYLIDSFVNLLKKEDEIKIFLKNYLTELAN